METLPRRFSVHAGRLHAHLRGLTAIARKRPRRDPPQHILTYIEALTRSYRAPTVKQHLAVLRMLFDG